MSRRWTEKGQLLKYRSSIGSFYLAKWDELNPKENCENTCWSITDLEVKEKRKGYGTRLINTAIRKAKKNEIVKIAVVIENTEEAIGFWRKIGVEFPYGYIQVGENE